MKNRRNGTHILYLRSIFSQSKRCVLSRSLPADNALDLSEVDHPLYCRKSDLRELWSCQRGKPDDYAEQNRHDRAGLQRTREARPPEARRIVKDKPGFPAH